MGFQDFLKKVADVASKVAVDAVKIYLRWLSLALRVAVGVTAIVVLTLVGLGLFKCSTTWVYTALLAVSAATWAFFLLLVAIIPGLIEGTLRQIPGVGPFIETLKAQLRHYLRLPAWVAFVALFVMSLLANFEQLRNPQSLLMIATIIAFVGASSLIGNVKWFRISVTFFTIIGILLLLVPLLPVRLKAAVGRTVRPLMPDGPKEVVIDPDSPPALFDGISQKPMVYYSVGGQVGYRFWDGKGYDKWTGVKLEPLSDSNRIRIIFDELRAHKHTTTDQLKKEAGDQTVLEKESLKSLRLQEATAMIPWPTTSVTNIPAVRIFDQDEYEKQQLAKIATKQVPPLKASAAKLNDSRWQLFLKNDSKTVLRISMLRIMQGGIWQDRGYSRIMQPGEQEFLAYDASFQTGDKISISCEDFPEPYIVLLQDR